MSTVILVCVYVKVIEAFSLSRSLFLCSIIPPILRNTKIMQSQQLTALLYKMLLSLFFCVCVCACAHTHTQCILYYLCMDYEVCSSNVHGCNKVLNKSIRIFQAYSCTFRKHVAIYQFMSSCNGGECFVECSFISNIAHNFVNICNFCSPHTVAEEQKKVLLPIKQKL